MRKIFYHGDFITLENTSPEAILIEDNIILQLGKKEEILQQKDKNTEVIDLKGKTMMPAFIDSHSHFLAVANNMLQASLNNCTSIKEIQEKLYEFKQEYQIEDGKWILANGYDHNNLKETKNITKNEIDKVLPNNPVVISHQSGHSGIINSMGLERLGITADTVAPEGGKIEKIEGELTGYLEENVFVENLRKIPMPEISEILKGVNKAQEKYASYGITTVQEGYMSKELIPIYESMLQQDSLYLDLVAYIESSCKAEIEKTFCENIKQYQRHLKIGGYKIFLDGSPQSKTAWMRTPYWNDNTYFGYGTMKDSEVEKIVKEAYQENMQLLAHCNGDRAAQQYIDAAKKVGENIKKIRPVLIHGQLLGIDQLDEVKKLGIIPSYFVAHTYYWGDVHIKNFGRERANTISPTGSSKRRKMIFTLHQDAPVIEPNMLETIWCAVNRKTKKGEILGEEEKIETIDAIKAVTINAAYQYFEENTKGSIKEGKKADLIILDKNPLKVPKEEIKSIRVLETIKEGETIFRL